VIKASICRNIFIPKRYLLTILLLASMFLLIDACSADDEILARQYAPILYFEKQETCFPVNVSYHIQNSYLYEFTHEGSILINESVSPETLAQYSSMGSEYTYLDNQKGTVDNYENIIRDYQNEKSTLGYTVYFRVFSAGNTKVVQYWMFYAFNKGELNRHEGDWELVQVVLTENIPVKVMYSQHYSGQKATWDQVEREGNHIKVYVARGSHANYLRFYSGMVGVASDIVGGNGKILTPDNYTLELLETQEWLNFSGRWGELNTAEDFILGRVGPQGPMHQDNGSKWKNPVSWGESLPAADENIFLLEWFLYNFLIFFILFTVVSLGIMGFRIYRRHKKYGLGPKIVSMLYIDSSNLKSLGNIFCFIGMFIAIFALFNPWYSVSYRVSGNSHFQVLKTAEMADLIKIDGITGIQVHLPGSTGFVPVGSFSIPFSFLIGIGLVFLILATIGVVTSRKLGCKYIWEGVKLLSIVVVILVAVMALAVLVSDSLPETSDTPLGSSIKEILEDIYNSPLGNQKTIYISGEGVSGGIYLQWGLGLGGKLLLVAGIILIIAGVLEIIAKTSFFEGKVDVKPKEQKLTAPPKTEESIQEEEYLVKLMEGEKT
jgi:hypothetical protein